jgi:hypothetical protein
MFERYTESARRSIFFARWEASQFGANEIGQEHLLLGLVRQEPALFGSAGKAVRDEIERYLPRAEKTSTSVDMPLSPALKRSLAYAAEEAERANHQHIGVEHMILGLAREGKAIADLLEKHGIDRDKMRRDIQPETDQELPDRASLHELVDKLPETAFRRAKRTLEHMQNWPAVPAGPPPGFPGMPPGMMGGGFGWAGSGGARADGWRRSSNRVEDGAEVFETHHFYKGQEITLVERYRLSEDGRKLTYSQEIHGPAKTVRHTIDFDISES